MCTSSRTPQPEDLSPSTIRWPARQCYIRWHHWQAQSHPRDRSTDLHKKQNHRQSAQGEGPGSIRRASRHCKSRQQSQHAALRQRVYIQTSSALLSRDKAAGATSHMCTSSRTPQPEDLSPSTIRWPARQCYISWHHWQAQSQPRDRSTNLHKKQKHRQPAQGEGTDTIRRASTHFQSRQQSQHKARKAKALTPFAERQHTFNQGSSRSTLRSGNEFTCRHPRPCPTETQPPGQPRTCARIPVCLNRKISLQAPCGGQLGSDISVGITGKHSLNHTTEAQTFARSKFTDKARKTKALAAFAEPQDTVNQDNNRSKLRSGNEFTCRHPRPRHRETQPPGQLRTCAQAPARLNRKISLSKHHPVAN